MTKELWIYKVQREAGERLAAEMAKPMPRDEHECGSLDAFDPWELFPIFGNYDGAFDKCAIEVLKEILSIERERTDLGADMFREMLCKMHLCDYGTSPRVCFPTAEFKALVPRLIEMWKEYSLIYWGTDVTSID